MKDHYITAVLTLLDASTEPAEVVRGLQNTLRARHHDALLLPVLRSVERTLTNRLDATQPLLTVRNEAALQSEAARIEAAKKVLGVTVEPTVQYDDTLIGGVVLEHNYQRVDASYKRALRTLFQTITN
jgi:hypothetical protein